MKFGSGINIPDLLHWLWAWSEECIAYPFLKEYIGEKVLRTLFLDAVNIESTAAGFEA